MDSFIGAAKNFLQEENGQQGSSRPGGSGISNFLGDMDFNQAHATATQHAGSSGDSDMFSSILGSVSQKQGRLAEEDVDEEDAVRKHKQTYEDDDNDNQDESSLGTAAAMQALKMFGQGQSGGSQSAFMGMAMSEASKLFDAKASSGKVASGVSKESTVQSAAEMAMKFYMKSQGGSSGGLMSMASKFM